MSKEIMHSRRISVLLLACILVASHSEIRADEPVPDSATAVEKSLQWLAAHQRDDGGWAMDGKNMARASSSEATGLALLAYLEAGQTHKEGKYKDEVRRGLAQLVKNIKVDDNAGDLRGRDGDMVAHAVAACALIEAYAKTHDKKLLAPAQQAANFTMQAQDKETDGWRRDAMSRPSMLAFGWQLQALKRAHIAYLQVSKESVLRANKHLDSVELNGGKFYAEHKHERDRRATAVGLYSRYILGWKSTDERVLAGLEFVGHEPQPHDALHNYFAHQLHFHAAEKTWPSWNAAIRQQLLESQVDAGDDAGSWFDADDRNADQGRLQQTALHSMILSMFRRVRLPPPRPEAEDEFPL